MEELNKKEGICFVHFCDKIRVNNILSDSVLRVTADTAHKHNKTSIYTSDIQPKTQKAQT